ncbi:hypothetical protein CVT26_015798 [Gymnopilus dilepis]|uniref:Uncharacterized protein n=1 Tax=Gymnopilus dilepis TaxID=231916 RepID=A0A409W4I5_9AGAR|nr:hypothetical protein CVT26_015798 [Gymnopilus dilepis]
MSCKADRQVHSRRGRMVIMKNETWDKYADNDDDDDDDDDDGGNSIAGDFNGVDGDEGTLNARLVTVLQAADGRGEGGGGVDVDDDDDDDDDDDVGNVAKLRKEEREERK